VNLKSRKTLILISIFLIAILAISTISFVSAATKTIGPKTPGGLKKAIDSAKNGDTIKLKNGVYSGTRNTKISITKSITIRGLGSKVILDGKKKNRIFLINKKSVNVKFLNLKFRNGYIKGKLSKNTGGGAIYSSKGTLTLSKCSFTNNRASSAGGGAIAIENKKLTANKCTFKNNRADGSGAAINSLKSKLVLTSNTFTNNRVKGNGGAIDLWYGSSTMNKCTFKNNQANICGGAINIFFNKANVKKSTFTSNRAITGGGGAIKILGSQGYKVGSLTVSGTTFTSNKANLPGGAILGTGRPIKIMNSNFKSNIAAKVYNAIDSPKNSLTLQNVKITPTDGSKV